MTTTFSQEDLAQISRLLDGLGVLVKSHQIYGFAHPRAARALQDYQENCSKVAGIAGLMGSDLLISYRDGHLFLQNMPLPEREHPARFLRGELAENGRSGFFLRLTNRESQIESMLDLLSGDDTKATRSFEWLSQEEISKRQGSATYQNTRANLLLGLDDLQIDLQLCDNLLSSLSSLMDECAESNEVDVAPLLQAGDELVAKFGACASDILPMTTIPYYDDYTYHHCINVALLSLSVAQHLVDSEEELRKICQAALLHDLGKSRVPREILYKPGRLNKTEIKVVENHPVHGAEMLTQFPNMDPLVVSVAFGHHIKDKGRGYPHVSSRFKLRPATRLVEVVDIFEALTAHRPYKKSLTAAQAFEILYSMPDLQSFRPYMDLLVQAVGYNPVGSRVRTADGEIGLVVGHENEDPKKPIVRKLCNTGQVTYLAEEFTADAAVASSDGSPAITDSTVVALDPEEDAELLESCSQA